MVFKRKIYSKLLDWKELSSGETAVMLEGARRIGKSTLALEFAKNEYEDYILLDFAKENNDIKNIFLENLSDLDAFFRNLFLLKGKKLKEKNWYLKKHFTARKSKRSAFYVLFLKDT